LGLLATGLVVYSIYTGYQVSTTVDQVKDGSKSTTTTTSREYKIPDSYLIVLGLILVILLAPEIKMAKVGPVEFDLSKEPLPIRE
jgi:hypothetical protein